MRAMTQDTRLEAIAGEPLVFTNAPMVQLRPFEGWSFIFVGKIAPPNPATATSGQQMTVSHTQPDRYAYFRENGTWLATIAPRQIKDGYVMVQSLNAQASSGWSLGRHMYLLTHSTWASEMLAVAYDKVLTPQQAEDVTRWLMLKLKLKEAPPLFLRILCGPRGRRSDWELAA